MQGGWVEPLRTSFGLEFNLIFKLGKRNVEQRTHAPLGSLNSVGGVATEINSINKLRNALCSKYLWHLWNYRSQ